MKDKRWVWKIFHSDKLNIKNGWDLFGFFK